MDPVLLISRWSFLRHARPVESSKHLEQFSAIVSGLCRVQSGTGAKHPSQSYTSKQCHNMHVVFNWACFYLKISTVDLLIEETRTACFVLHPDGLLVEVCRAAAG